MAAHSRPYEAGRPQDHGPISEWIYVGG